MDSTTAINNLETAVREAKQAIEAQSWGQADKLLERVATEADELRAIVSRQARSASSTTAGSRSP